MTNEDAPQYLICSLNFKSRNFQTESLLMRVASTYRGSTTLCFSVLQLCLMLRILLIQNPAHVEQWVLGEANFFCTRPSNQSYVQNRHKQVFFCDQEMFAFCKSLSHSSSSWIPTSSAKVFFQETPAKHPLLAACQNEY